MDGIGEEYIILDIPHEESIPIIKQLDKKVICGIYSIRNKINGKKYIGSSVDIYRRWGVHLRNLVRHRHPNEHLQRAWDQYGKNNFEFVIEEICDPDVRFVKEQEWCDNYQTYNRDKGYNIAKIIPFGATGFTIEDIKDDKSVMSYEQFNQIIDLFVNTDIPLTEVAKEVEIDLLTIHNIYYRISYKTLTKDYVFKKRKRYDGSKLTLEQVKEIIIKLQNKEPVSRIAKEYNVSNSAIAGIKYHRTWKEYTEGIEFENSDECRITKGGLIQYDLNGNIINRYNNAKEAERITGIKSSAIGATCLGRPRHLTAGGFVWRYGNDAFNKYTITPKDKKHTISVDQYKDGKFIKTYNSIKEAEEATGATHICQVIKGRGKTSGGFEWKKHINKKEGEE